jgi:hypothetical protein
MCMRMATVYRAAKRPLPKFSDDDVVDYLVTEAVTFKVAEERKKQEEDARRREWQKKTDDLRRRVGA